MLAVTSLARVWPAQHERRLTRTGISVSDKMVAFTDTNRKSDFSQIYKATSGVLNLVTIF